MSVASVALVCSTLRIYTGGMKSTLMVLGAEDISKGFSINIWCGVIGDHLLGPQVIHGILTVAKYLEFLQDTLSLFMDDVPLATRR